MLFVALTVAGVFVRGVRPPGYPLTPVIFLPLSAVLLFLLAANAPRQALLGTAVVSLGLLVYRLAFRSHD
jgi:hypothetical protein